MLSLLHALICSTQFLSATYPPPPLPICFLSTYIVTCACFFVFVGWVVVPALGVLFNLRDAGLSKVAGCRWKSLPNCLVSAGYSAWHFLRIAFKLNIPGQATYFENSAVYFKTFRQPWGWIAKRWRPLDTPGTIPSFSNVNVKCNGYEAWQISLWSVIICFFGLTVYSCE